MAKSYESLKIEKDVFFLYRKRKHEAEFQKKKLMNDSDFMMELLHKSYGGLL